MKINYKIITLLSLIIMFSVSNTLGQGRIVYQEGAIHKVEQLKKANTSFSEICPAIVGNELYYSLRKESTSNRRSKENFYAEYKVDLDSTGNVLSFPELVKGFGNDYHEGPVSYCPSTGELFVTTSFLSDPVTISGMVPVEEVKLNIVVKEYKNNKWITKEDFQYNLDGYNVAHPAITSSGDTLYFVSDMPGGFGGNDIYYCVRTSNGWGKPNNLGKSVNTSGDEMFPCLTEQGQLFFSSDGYQGLGGLDIYYVNFPISPTSEIYALKEPVNSISDDFGLTFNKEMGVGFFSSDRSGGYGSDDLYVMSLDSIQVELIAVSTGTGEYLEDAEITLKNSKGKIIPISNNRTNSEGVFTINLPANTTYEFSAYKEGFDVGHRSFDLTISNLLTGKYRERINIDPIIEEPEPEVIDESYQYNPYYVLFEFDKSQIMPKYNPVLEALANAHKQTDCLVLLLGGHTDSEGTDEYNQILSERRASAVRNTLVDAGADPNRIRIVGYGEEHPLMDEDTDYARAMNRRVEFTNVAGDCNFNVDSLFEMIRETYEVPEPVEVAEEFSTTITTKTPTTYYDGTAIISLKKYSPAYLVQDDGYYKIQLGAYMIRENAEELNTVLKAAFSELGDNFIVVFEEYYKVRIGKFDTREEAIKFGKKYELEF